MFSGNGDSNGDSNDGNNGGSSGIIFMLGDNRR